MSAAPPSLLRPRALCPPAGTPTAMKDPQKHGGCRTGTRAPSSAEDAGERMQVPNVATLAACAHHPYLSSPTKDELLLPETHPPPAERPRPVLQAHRGRPSQPTVSLAIQHVSLSAVSGSGGLKSSVDPFCLHLLHEACTSLVMVVPRSVQRL